MSTNSAPFLATYNLDESAGEEQFGCERREANQRPRQSPQDARTITHQIVYTIVAH